MFPHFNLMLLLLTLYKKLPARVGLKVRYEHLWLSKETSKIPTTSRNKFETQQ